MSNAIDGSLNGIADLAGLAAGPSDKQAQKQSHAANDFEALLIGQMLRSMREQGSSWLGTDDDDAAGATAFAFGEEELAKAIAKGGGFGLSKIISKGLDTKAAQAERDGPGGQA